MMGVSSVKRIDKSIKVINEKELEYINLKRRYEKATKDKLKLAHLLTQVNSELEESLNNEKEVYRILVRHEFENNFLNGILRVIGLEAFLGLNYLGIPKTKLKGRKKEGVNSLWRIKG